MGVMLLFLCTGSHELSRGDAPPVAAAQQSAISKALRQVIAIATNADPKQRYSSAAKLRDALAATLSHSPAVPDRRRERSGCAPELCGPG